MKAAVFYKQLGVLTLLIAGVMLGLSRTIWFQGTMLFSLSSLFLFVVFTVMIFLLAIRSVDSPNKNQFTAVAFLAIFGKLILTLAILLSYNYLATPGSKAYVILFLIIYLAFTIFETGIMMKIAKPSESEK